MTLGGQGGVLATGFGSAMGVSAPPVAQTRVVPGSDVVQRVVPDQQTGQQVGEPLRRVGWSGISSALDRYVAEAELRPDEYTIDYTTGEITLSERDPTLLAVGPTAPEQLWVRYQFQTNTASDTVRVSHATRELITVNLGVVQFAARGGDAIPMRMTQRIRVRNMSR